jgi:hypothetical protein
VIEFVTFQVSQPYNKTAFTFLLKMFNIQYGNVRLYWVLWSSPHCFVMLFATVSYLLSVGANEREVLQPCRGALVTVEMRKANPVFYPLSCKVQ